MTEAQRRATSAYKKSHKEELNNYAKQYYKENNDRLLTNKLEKLICEVCRTTITRGNKYRHEQTKKHKEYMVKNNKIEQRYRELLDKYIDIIQELVNKNGRVTSWSPERIYQKLKQSATDITEIYMSTITGFKDKNIISLNLALDWHAFIMYLNTIDSII